MITFKCGINPSCLNTTDTEEKNRNNVGIQPAIDVHP
jgi:hypothetical protein